MGWSLKFTLAASTALVTAMCIATYFGLASPNFTALMILGLCIAISLASDNPLPEETDEGSSDAAPTKGDKKSRKAK